MALNKAKMIMVTSVKGGTGKSTTVLNLAGILALKKLKTIIVDLDLYSGVIAPSLNLTEGSDIYTLCEDMINNRFDQFSDYIRNYNEYIDVLAAPLDPRSVSKIKAKYINMILTRLRLQYDVVLIDTNHIIDQINLVSLDASDIILYVITNDLMDLKNMKTMVSIYKDMGKENYKVILNKARGSNTDYSVYDVRNVIGKEVDYVLPKSFYRKNIEDFVYDGKIMTLDKTIMRTKGALVLEEIVNKIV